MTEYDPQEYSVTYAPDPVLWDHYIAAENCYAHNLYNWKTVLEDFYQRTVVQIAVLDKDGQVEGVFFGYHNRFILYSTYFGFHAKTPQAAVLLRSEIYNYAAEKGLFQGVITSGPRDYSEHFPNTIHKNNMILPLEPSTGPLLDSLPKKTRNIVKKAQKSNIEISVDPTHMTQFYEIYKGRYQEKGLPPKPEGYFEALLKVFGSELTLLTAFHNNQIIAGMLFLKSLKAASYLVNASTDQGQKLGANNLLMWKAMEFFRQSGLESIELAESTIDGPVHNFKKRLSKNAEHIDIFYYICSFQSSKVKGFFFKVQSKIALIRGCFKEEKVV